MRFADAFKFPYNNLPKVLTIALGFALVVTGMVIFILRSDSTWGATLLTLAVVLAQSLFLGGYGIRVIRQVAHHGDILPPIELGQDIGRGIVVTLAGIFYFLPLLALFILVSILAPSGRAQDATAFFCLFAVVAIGLGIFLAFGFLVGMARYAVEEDRGAMFALSTNMGIARNNVGAIFSLIAHQIVMAIIYFGITWAVDNVVSSAIINPIFDSFDFQTAIIIIVAVSYVISTTLSILQNFANLHLIAQFAEQIGLLPTKQKHDAPHDYGTSF